MKKGFSPVATVVVATLTLLVGFVLGSLFSTGDPIAPVGSSGPVHAPAQSSSEPVRDRTERSAVLSSAPIATATPAGYRVSDAEFERARAAIDAAPATPATGGEQIRGRVGTNLGEPLGGAVVVATLRTESDPYGSPSAKVGAGQPIEESLDEVLRRQADQWAGSRGRRYRGVSAADGSYVIDGLPVGRFSIAAYREGFVLRTVGDGYSVDSGGTQDFTADPVIEIRAELRLPDGSAPELAAIRIERGGSRNTLRWTRDDPVIRVAAAEGDAVAMADFVVGGGYGSSAPPRMRSEPVPLRGAGDHLVIELQPTRGIYGRIKGSAANGSGEVRLLELARNPDASDEAFQKSALRADVSRGSFDFLGLEPGSYAVGLLGPNESLLAKAECVVTSGLVERHLEIPEPSAENSLRVRCLGPDGLPLHGVSFQYMTFSRGRGTGSSVRNPQRDPVGSYWLPAIALGIRDFGDLPDDDHVTITAEHPQFGRSVGEVRGTQTELVLQFTEPCRLTVVVPGFAQSPLRGRLQVAVVEQLPPEDASSTRIFRHRSQRTEQQVLAADGTATFPGLHPGRWHAQLRLSDRTWSGRSIAVTAVDLTGSEQSVNLVPPSLHEVVITAPALEKGARVWMNPKAEDSPGQPSPLGDMRLSGNLDDQLRFVQSDVPAGTYVVQVNGITRPMEIVVPGGPYVMEGPKIDCVRVAISDTEGALYRAGLRPGDLVIAIDGKTFDGTNWWQVMHEHAAKKNVPLLVLRKGERITISCDEFVWQGTEAGGSLAPASTEDD